MGISSLIFSIFDAREAGFEKVIFIIKKAIEEDFKIHIGNRISKYMDVAYVTRSWIRFRMDTRCLRAG